MLLDNETVRTIMDRMSQIEIAGIKSEYIYDDKRVPRVTEVLSTMLHKDGLMNWSNGLGWKRISYRAFMKDAAEKGTYSHLAVEKYLRNGYVDLDEMHLPNDQIRATVNSCMDAFVAWWTRLNEEHSDVEIIFLEETMVHPYFGGTCDCLLKVDGKYWLIDFKTSNHMNYNYALQLAAYRFLLKELKGIDIEVAMVLRLSKTDHVYYEHKLNLTNQFHVAFLDNCLETFMFLVMAFKMRVNTESEYEEIFGKK